MLDSVDSTGESRYPSDPAHEERKDAMATRLHAAKTPISRERGRMRIIPPNRARDEDLHVFLGLHQESLRVTSRDLDELIRPA